MIDGRALAAIDVFFENPQIRETLSSLGIFAVDYASGRAFPSAFWKDCGYGSDQIVNPILPDVIHPDDRERVIGHIDAMKERGENEYSDVFRVRRRDGSEAWVAASYFVIYRDSSGVPLLFIGHDQDVTAIKRGEEDKARRLEEIDTLRQVVDRIGSSLDLSDTVSSILEQTRRVIPYDKASVQILEGSRLRVIGCHGFRDRESTMKLEFDFPVKGSPSTLAIQSRRPVVCNDITREFPMFKLVPGEEPIKSWLGIPLIGNNEVIGMLALDSTKGDFYTERHLEMATTFAAHVAMAVERARLYENALSMALTDNLTGAGNRHSLHMQGNFILEKAKRDKSRVTALMLDLDFFKRVNDDFGHDTGDEVLRGTATTIRDILRHYDLLFRYGGEEFLVLLMDANEDEARAIAERIRSRFENARFPCLDRTQTVSVGIGSAIPHGAMTLSDIVKLADTALYRAKNSGRNRVEENVLP